MTRTLQSGRFSGRNLATVFSLRGSAYGRQGQLDRAIADYSQAIRLKPDYAKAFGNRGWRYETNGKRDLALQDYKKAYALGLRPPALLEAIRRIQ